MLYLTVPTAAVRDPPGDGVSGWTSAGGVMTETTTIASNAASPTVSQARCTFTDLVPEEY